MMFIWKPVLSATALLIIFNVPSGLLFADEKPGKPAAERDYSTDLDATQYSQKQKDDMAGKTDAIFDDSSQHVQHFVPLDNSGLVQAPPHPIPEYPAMITSVDCPLVVSSSISINGQDFGESEGTVLVAFRDEVFSCEIIEWSDIYVSCSLPSSMVLEFGREPKEAVIWLRPARISPPAPGTACSGEGCGETPYYYNGEEGPRYTCMIQPIPAACTGVDLVLNKIDARKWSETSCAAKVWISQVCAGETTVESFYALMTEGEEDYAAGWTIRAGWQGPTPWPLESGWLVRSCGTITGVVDYLNVESEINEENNVCSVTIGDDQDYATQTCYPFE
jgi:hypothetical protein